VNETQCKAVEAGSGMSYGNNSNCFWDRAAGRCESRCAGYPDEPTCLQHRSENWSQPSCAWQVPVTEGLGEVHGKAFLSANDVYAWGGLSCYGEQCVTWPVQSTAYDWAAHQVQPPDPYRQLCFGQGVSAFCPRDGSLCPQCANEPGVHFCYKVYVGQTMAKVAELFAGEVGCRLGTQRARSFSRDGRCSDEGRLLCQDVRASTRATISC
jgi:hypothetical protein